ncbi:MAG: cytochrome P450 [Myxococcota bacterium]|nr:cytochrome P450 [Myxococcota bacterium]
MSATPLSEFNPFDPAILEDPFEWNRRLREEAPVYREPKTGITFVSTYAAVTQVVRDHQTFSNRFGPALASGAGGGSPEVAAELKKGWPPVDTMLTADPPAQRRFRKLVNRAFLPRRVDGLTGRITELSHELIDGFAADGRCELLSQYAGPLPLTVIAEQLGVPREDLPLFRRFSDGFVAQLGQMADAAGQVEAAKLIVEFQHYFAAKLEERQRAPSDDILSDIVNARVEDERPLDTAESLSILQQILVAGNETTANAITEGMWLLITHPEAMAAVRADPALIPNLVEEVLRLATPTQTMWRVATRDTEVEGVAIPEGSVLMVRYAAANRDPAVFEDPERFDPARDNADQHLAFGLGAHFCLGALLARKEMQIAFSTLLERISGWQLAPDAGRLRHRPNVLLRGLEALPLVFDPA